MILCLDWKLHSWTFDSTGWGKELVMTSTTVFWGGVFVVVVVLFIREMLGAIV